MRDPKAIRLALCCTLLCALGCTDLRYGDQEAPLGDPDASQPEGDAGRHEDDARSDGSSDAADKHDGGDGGELPPGPARITSLTPDFGVLVPDFDPLVTEYT